MPYMKKKTRKKPEGWKFLEKLAVKEENDEEMHPPTNKKPKIHKKT
jgi:hypothetical protein